MRERTWGRFLVWVATLWLTAAAGADITTIGGSISAFADTDDGREDFRFAQADFGLTQLAFTGPGGISSSTRVEQRLIASATELVLDGSVVAETGGSNKATSGSVGGFISFTVGTNEAYDLVLSVTDAGTRNVERVELRESGLSDAIFSSMGGVSLVVETLNLDANRTYELITEFDASVEGRNGPETSRAEYRLSLTPVPEPGAAAVVGILAAAGLRRRRSDAERVVG